MLLLIAVVFALSLDGGAALAQTASGEPEPQAVEPQAGEAAPAAPGATTPTVEPVPEPVVTGTAGGAAPAGPATTTETPATAGGSPGAASDDDSGLSWADAGVLALAALLIAAAIMLVLWQLRGWDPRWLRRWRHATAEAGWRVSLGWAEFRDFVRLGR